VLAGKLRLSFKKPFLKNYLLAHIDLPKGRLYLVKPLTFMNRSGDIFPDLLKRTVSNPEHLLVVCDTLDLPVGQCRLRRCGSSAGHKGLAAVIRRLGREDFPRIYIGIGRPNRRGDVVQYVLSEPRETDRLLLAEAVERAADAVLQVMEEGLEGVMNAFNQKIDGS
jgi:PTH1 family peptidyl-tRNA hydrolase